jgi:hypothetical protein
LKGVKGASATSNLDPVMILSAVNLFISQEIPNLSSRGQRNGAGKTYKAD